MRVGFDPTSALMDSTFELVESRQSRDSTFLFGVEIDPLEREFEWPTSPSNI